MDYKTDMDNLNGLMDHFIEEIIITDKDKVMDNFIMLKIQVLAEDFGKRESLMVKVNMFRMVNVINAYGVKVDLQV